MAKWIKAEWVLTNPQGGVSMQAFYAINERRVQDPKTKRYFTEKDKIPHKITTNVLPGGEQLHKLSGEMLTEGQFVVMDIPANREVLRCLAMCEPPQIQMCDIDMQEEILCLDRTEAPEDTEVVVDEKVIEDVTIPGSVADKASEKVKQQDKMAAMREKKALNKANKG